MTISLETESDSKPQLVRGIGLGSATALNMIDMIGVGPFITIPLIVTAMGAKSENALEDVLKDLAIPFRTVGDAKTPRRILEAIHEGYRAGEEIYTK